MAENGGPGLVVVGVLVVLLLVGVVRGVVGAEDGETSSPTPAETTPARGGADSRRIPSTTSTVVEAVESSAAPEVTETGAEAAPGTVAPVGPGLPPELAEQVQAVATEVLRADVSGEGRERFADYWGEDLYRPCCRNVVVHTSVARAVEGREGTVVVSLVWSGEPVAAGSPREYVGTDVYLIERAGSWVAIRPAEGGA